MFVLLICGFFSSCAGSYFNSNVETKYPGGLDLYLSKCGGCHRLHERNEFTGQKWDKILTRMQKKSKISDEQTEKILKFLTEVDTIKSGNPAKILSGN